MRTWLRKLEALAVAAAFAEEGEWQAAGSILRESEKRETMRESLRVRQSRTRAREQSYRA